ncbi:histone lysine set [Cystoisospora suis]|uniref:Histone lysine set n=1 Tax=Cystoisospora suis TaxID=483139 RepID=A0A2C6KP19_9APIC|nr:histone lysine set [Cystoisospora suis]
MSTALVCSGAAAFEREKKLEGQQRGTGICAVSVTDDQSWRGRSPAQSGCWDAPACPTSRRSDSSPEPHTARTAGRTGPSRRADESTVGSVSSQRHDNTAENRSPETEAWPTAHSPCTPSDCAPPSPASDVSELSSGQVVCDSQSIPSMRATTPKSELRGETESRLSVDAISPCRTPVKCTLLPSIGCGLTVSASSLGRGSGLGVYACRPYSARSRVGEYAGVCVDRKVAMMLRGMGTSTHVMRVGMQYQYLVGYRLPFLFAGGGAFVNDGRWFADGRKGPGVSVRFHVAYDKKRAKDRVYVVATKDIEAGEEIFTSYDNQYWALLR